jgi:hypothetical protein
MTTISYSFEKLLETFPTIPIYSTKNVIYTKPSTPSEALHEVVQLLLMISDTRSADHSTWFEIGTILYNVSMGSRNGIQEWITFSKRTTTFTEDDCLKAWIDMKPNPSHASIHTLFQYVTEDSLYAYQQYKHTISYRKLSQLVKDKLHRLKPCHFGEVLYLLCKYEFLYDDEKGWYQLKDNRWNSCSKECRILRNSISVIKEMMMTEYKNMYSNVISPLQNIIRDIEDKEEMSTEDGKRIEEHYKKVTELEENRQFLLTICDKLDELTYKNKIIKECTDLFYDTDGIIARYVMTENVNDNIITAVTIENQMIPCKEKGSSIESLLKAFIRYVISDEKYKVDIILLSSDELLQSFKEFTCKNNINTKINKSISLILQLKKLEIYGIVFAVRSQTDYKDLKKTQFTKSKIKLYNS